MHWYLLDWVGLGYTIIFSELSGLAYILIIVGSVEFWCATIFGGMIWIRLCNNML